MNHARLMKSPLAILLLVGVVVDPDLGVGQESNRSPSQPHFSGQAPGSAQKILRKFKAEIVTVDTNRLVLTIRRAGSPENLKITAKTKFTRDDDKPAAFKDVQPGQAVEITAEVVYEKLEEAVTLNILTK
jgi:carbamoylphosphate synthase small subunit